ncbi:carboxypeptidase-like regulatory domain-containing protein [Dyadobacter psychrotolerans]|uniref:TonB C-terminal domain-containing protein n=1 Tax=Dyadobacter psychrotolerans TaxID=2541721 RepID=A0A4R5DES0_9BACT|nr:carboxypeptidase-like regulatory domain-containing protein [Dyadobacter psychrotolerans]TDE10244.1 hypothetical protein E0F88_28530 [Dyadobacter psychrotolerans]
MADDKSKYDLTDFQRYQVGSMSFAEQHSFEKRLLDDPFLAEAYQGFTELHDTGSDHQHAMENLRLRFENRVEDKKSKSLPLWLTVAAAIFLITFGIVWLGYLQDNRKIPQNVAVQQPKPEGVLSVRADSFLVLAEPKIQQLSKLKKVSPTQAPELTPADAQLRVLDSLPTLDIRTERIVQSAPQRQPFAIKGVPTAGLSVYSYTKRAISGQVTDQQGNPLPGVSVALSPRQSYTTDKDGRFLITGKIGDSLMLSFIGYKTHKQPITKTDLANIKLEEDTQMLSEVVVVGYGKAEYKRSFRTASAVIGEPSPTGGWQAFGLYLNRTAEESTGKAQLEITFMVSEKGELSDFKSNEKSENFERAVQLIKAGPAWIPARNELGNRIDKRVSLTLPYQEK